MGKFVKVATLSEIAPGQRKSAWVKEQRVLLLNIDGKLYACDESCPHRECSMAKGDLEGTVLVCPCHYAKFDLETGEVLQEPTKYPPTPPLPVHEVKIDGWDVLVSLSLEADYI
jgi:3-phenylpropionate/trans-cinnamate dioxygenase ferredoxin subunit